MAIKKILLAFLLLTGCMVGPDFTPPANIAPKSWFRAKPQEAASQPVENLPIDSAWWRQLGDPQLDALVARIAAQNLDVQTATARLEESRSQTGITAAGLFPQLNGDASYTREKESDKGVISLLTGSGGGNSSGGQSSTMGVPSAMTSPPFNVYQYGFDASWEIDLWGRVRRGVEASGAQAQATVEARRGAELSAIAELVSDYVQLRGAQASLATLSRNLEAAGETITLTKERARNGIGNELDVANASAQAAQTQSQIPPLQQRETAMKNAIAFLLGQLPGGLEAELASAHPVPPVPVQVPIGIPSELAHRRPDIREAEAQLHAATAEIGMAKADFFPRVTLMGNGDLQALKYSDLNSWAARTYSYGPSISLPIFEGGRLVSTLELRKASARKAAIAYRKTLLNAFHEVDNALTALRTGQQRHAALVTAARQNETALKLATELYKKGLNSFLDVLTAEHNLFDAQLQELQSAQEVSVNMVQLYKALGGGWENDFPLHASVNLFPANSFINPCKFIRMS